MLRALPSALAIAVVVLSVPSPAQEASSIDPLDAALAAWRGEHGDAWQIEPDGAGRAAMVYGGRAAPAFAPVTDDDFDRLARLALAATETMHGVAPATLVLDRTRFLPLGQIGASDKMSVRYVQRVGGVPVYGGSVNVLLDARGGLLAVQSNAIAGEIDLQTTPTFAPASAVRVARSAFERETGLPPTRVGDPALFVYRREREEDTVPALVWRIEVVWGQPDTEPVGFAYFVDAHAGDVVDRERTVHNFDVGGTIQTLASPGTAPDIPSNPEAPFAMSYVDVQSDQGTVSADANGHFNFPGVSTLTNVRLQYRGDFANVTNAQGGLYTLEPGSLTGTSNSLSMNPGAVDTATAQANAYVSIYQLRDWVRSIMPTDDTADFTAAALVNIDSQCNAFFNGSSVNFFRAGGCVNTAYSTVVTHEMGHWLNVLYGTNNGFDGMGEGNADVFAMYLDDTPIVGQNWNGGSGFIRTGNNTRQFCGNCCPACYGEVHADGEVWMGAAWKVRANIKNAIGNAAGSLAANTLFLGWMNGFDQGSIKPVIETQWLVLDDDDGSIVNGTPHYSSINAGFLAQGFPGYNLPAVGVDDLTQLPNTPDVNGPYTVEAYAVANANPPLSSVQLWYSVNDSAFASVPMSSIGNNRWTGDIPGQSSVSVVRYYVRATDSQSNSATVPANAPNVTKTFTVGDLRVLFEDELQFPQPGWTVQAQNLTGGQWEHGAPHVIYNGSVMSQSDRDHTPGFGTKCYFTGQSPVGASASDNDVDGGPTILRSPPVSYNGFSGVVDYAYWLYNDDGDDELVVEVAAADLVWVEVARHGNSNGWKESSFVISQFLPTPLDVVNLRFSVADNPNNSITEAAVDDLVFWTDEPEPCVPNFNVFCTSLPCSTNIPAAIATSGTASVSANDLVLQASNLPPTQNGIFIYSPDEGNMPLGNGTLCLGTQTIGFILRLFPPVTSDVAGNVAYPLDMDNPPLPVGQITAGSTWKFQCWFRDNFSHAPFFNLSSAISITFCP